MTTSELSHIIRGTTAAEFAAAIEAEIRAGRLPPGEPLPPVRALAAALGVSPTTIAASYQRLQRRGLVVSAGRRGTQVSHLPLGPRPRPAEPALRPGTVDLADGNPDPALLPAMAPALRRVDPAVRLYGGSASDPGLLAIAARDLSAAGVSGAGITFTSGASDAIDRVLADNFRPGDRIAIEDPIYGNVLELVLARGLIAHPVAIDAEGPRPAALARALDAGCRGVIVTPRAQNPTGAALSPERARALATTLAPFPAVLIIEDDHQAHICAEPLVTLHPGRARWAHVRSYSKSLNPDLRLAAVTGDPETIARLEDRLVLGERWVSHILQRTAAALLSDAGVRRRLDAAMRTYSARREALVRALADAGIASPSRSGYNVWIPVAEETPVVQGMAARGWAVRAGERFRMASPPAIRITAARLEPATARQVAQDLRSLLARAAPIAATC